MESRGQGRAAALCLVLQLHNAKHVLGCTTLITNLRVAVQESYFFKLSCCGGGCRWLRRSIAAAAASAWCTWRCTLRTLGTLALSAPGSAAWRPSPSPVRCSSLTRFCQPHEARAELCHMHAASRTFYCQDAYVQYFTMSWHCKMAAWQQ